MMYNALPYGRVKSAGFTIRDLYLITSQYLDNPSLSRASQVTQTLNQARKKPPLSLQKAFFPRVGSSLKAILKSSPALLRPFLGTHQGPGGQFGAFKVIPGSDLSPSRMIKRAGIAITEPFLEDISHKEPALRRLIGRIKSSFSSLDYAETGRALGVLKKAIPEKKGTSKSKGYDYFFFIRTVKFSDEYAHIPTALVKRIESEANKLIATALRKATVASTLPPGQLPLPKIINSATHKSAKVTNLIASDINYFQSDVLIKNNGNFIIDSIHLPDVGFFLSTIKGDNTFTYIKHAINKLMPKVNKHIIQWLMQKTSTKSAVIYLVTRDEVIHNKEDVLEQTELQVIQRMLKQNGYSSKIVGVSKATLLPPNSIILLFNVNTAEDSFSAFLQSYQSKGFSCTPNPFLLLFQHELNTYKKVILNEEAITDLKALVTQIELTKPGEIYRQLLALKQYLSLRGFEHEELFIFQDAHGHRVNAHVADLKSFQVALNEFHSGGPLSLFGYNFHPDDALIISDDGPVLAHFRFVFVPDHV